MPEECNFYKLLQVDPEAETIIIRYAYGYLSAKYHPYNPETGSRELFTQLTEAWKVLSNDERRAAYDDSLRNAEK
jgi:DnaJ-class molecular chaperone